MIGGVLLVGAAALAVAVAWPRSSALPTATHHPSPLGDSEATALPVEGSSAAHLPVPTDSGISTASPRRTTSAGSMARVPDTKVDSTATTTETTAPPRRPLAATSFHERYAAVQRMLKQRGSNDMWQRFQRIDVNTVMVFPDKQREANAILSALERELDGHATGMSRNR